MEYIFLSISKTRSILLALGVPFIEKLQRVSLEDGIAPPETDPLTLVVHPRSIASSSSSMATAVL